MTKFFYRQDLKSKRFKIYNREKKYIKVTFLTKAGAKALVKELNDHVAYLTKKYDPEKK